MEHLLYRGFPRPNWSRELEGTRGWYSPSPGQCGLGGGEYWVLSAGGVSFVRESLICLLVAWALPLLHLWLPSSDDPRPPIGYPLRYIEDPCFWLIFGKPSASKRFPTADVFLLNTVIVVYHIFFLIFFASFDEITYNYHCRKLNCLS